MALGKRQPEADPKAGTLFSQIGGQAVVNAPREAALVTHLDPKSPVAEAYRTLRTNLRFAGLDSPIRKVLLTSAGPEEGKSVTTANLAVAVAQSGQSVVVVGCDLRKPTLHRIFGLPGTVGLTNVLLGQCSLGQAIQNTGIEGLSMLAGGPVPPNPSELLGSEAMSRVLDELAGKFDMVIVDSPPIIAVTDAAVLARKVDGVLLVISVGTVPREIAKTAQTLLENVKARILGVVLNRVPVQDNYGYYYYYYAEKNGQGVAG